MAYTTGGLYLQKKGKLVQVDWKYNRTKKQGRYVTRNVTQEAFAWLFSPVTIDDGVTLRDIMGLVAKDPIIQAVFTRDFSKELIAEYNKKPARSKKQKPWEVIEYLELYHHWQLNSHTSDLEGLWLLGLHGTGVQLKEDVLQDGYVMHKKGERIPWSVSFSSPSELAHLPVKVCQEVKVVENDMRKQSRDNYGNVLHKFNFATPTLGQVLHGIFYDLSFYGAGEERNSKKDEIMGMAEEVISGRAKTKPFKDIPRKKKPQRT